MLAASHCGSKLLILSQNTTGLPVPFPFFEAEGFLPVTIFEAEGAPPFAFFEGWDDGWSSALRTLRIVEPGLHHSVELTRKRGPSGRRKPF